MAGWNAHSDREDDDDECRRLREKIRDLKATIQMQARLINEAEKWVRDYETAHGLFKNDPHMPDFLIVF